MTAASQTISRLKTGWRLIAVWTAIAVGGCLSSASRDTDFVGTIERVVWLDGVHALPGRAGAPLNCVQIRGTESRRVLMVYFAAMYSSQEYGARGDVVRITTRGALPASDAVWREDLLDYRVLRRSSSAGEPSSRAEREL